MGSHFCACNTVHFLYFYTIARFFAEFNFDFRYLFIVIYHVNLASFPLIILCGRSFIGT